MQSKPDTELEAFVTKDEAIEKARAIAEAEGWPWEPPAYAVVRRRGFLLGARYWEVRSNSARRGRNVEVVLDYESGEVLAKAFFGR